MSDSSSHMNSEHGGLAQQDWHASNEAETLRKLEANVDGLR